MRVAMLSLTGQPGPVDACHLTCGTATVLVGKNDAGKTYVLEGVDAALRDDANWWFSASLELFVTVAALDELGEHRIAGWEDYPETGGTDWLEQAFAAPPPEIDSDVLTRLLQSGETAEGTIAVMTTPVEGLPVSVWLCATPWNNMDGQLRQSVEQS